MSLLGLVTKGPSPEKKKVVALIVTSKARFTLTGLIFYIFANLKFQQKFANLWYNTIFSLSRPLSTALSFSLCLLLLFSHNSIPVFQSAPF